MKAPSGNLSKRLVLYGLGAGAVTAAIAVAHAKGHGKGGHGSNILYSGPVEFSGDEVHFDLQNIVPPSSTFFSGDDFDMKSDCVGGQAKIVSDSSTYSPKVAAFFDCGRIYAQKLSNGDTIGLQPFSSIGYFDDIYVGPGDTTNNENCGAWAPGDRGFLGLRIRIDCTDYFGWADVTLNNLDCEGGPVFTLHSYALNLEPNESIAAGETKARKKHLHFPAPTCTPTPSPTPTPTPTVPVGGVGSAIALLIAGASGIPSLRKRRETSLSI